MSALIEALQAAGVGLDLLMEVVRLEERVAFADHFEEREFARREYNAEKMRRSRAKKAAVTSRDVTYRNSAATIEKKESKKEESKKDSQIRKIGFPEGFKLSDDDMRLCRDLGWSDLKISAEFAKFRDHASANARRQADWHAAWRNWVRSPYQKPSVNGVGGVTPRPGSKEDQREKAADAYRELTDYVHTHTDDARGCGAPSSPLAGLLPLIQPPRS